MIARGAAQVAGVATLVVALGGVIGAAAASAPGAYGDWTVNGSTGTMTVPAAGFPSATFTTNSTSPAVENGRSIFLGPATPFGSVFGSSQGQEYAVLRTAAHLAPSTTTFTFQTPAPGGNWSFALGNIDADQVTITATDAAGNPVSADDLGFQSSFNYCAVSPRPSGCGSGTFTDRPIWNPTTSTLIGNGSDTSGATGWFRPAVDIKTLTFTFSRIVGSPSYQVWFAALSADITGSVATTTGEEPPPTTVHLLHPDNSPVHDVAGRPVTTVTGTHGRYAFRGVLRGNYVVTFDPPTGFRAQGVVRRAVDATRGDVSGVNFVLRREGPPVIPVTG